jgi:hypothetical protein
MNKYQKEINKATINELCYRRVAYFYTHELYSEKSLYRQIRKEIRKNANKYKT